MLSMTTDIFTVITLIFKMLRLHVKGIAKNQFRKHREKLPRVLSAVSNIPQDL